MATLADRVQALPQELYDEIYHLTFTAVPSIQHISKAKGYRPPSCLQVNRATRKTIAPVYYSSIFYITREDGWRWIASLSRSHFEMLNEVRILNMAVQLNGPISYTGIKISLRQQLYLFDQSAAAFGRDDMRCPVPVKFISQRAHERIMLKPQTFKFKVVRGIEWTWRSV